MSKLDIKNGLYEFKLGSSYELYKPELSYSGSDNNIDYYLYTGTKHDGIFSIKWDRLMLGFFRNKLYYIQVKVAISSEVLETTLIDDFNDFFGPGKVVDGTGGYGATWAYIWDTKKISMQLSKGQYSSLDKEKSDVIVMFMISKAIKNQMLNSQF